MRWRSIFSALLAVAFLSAPSWAMVCDLGCISSTQRQACSTCEPASHAAAAHLHCAHMDDQASLVTAHAELTAFSPCAHAHCSQPVSANLPAKAFSSEQRKWTESHPSAARLETGIVPVRYMDKATPPILTDYNRPLTVALRI